MTDTVGYVKSVPLFAGIIGVIAVAHLNFHLTAILAVVVYMASAHGRNPVLIDENDWTETG